MFAIEPIKISAIRLSLVAAALTAGACVTSTGASISDVTGDTLALSNCPVFTEQPGVQVFDELAWTGHLAAAGEQAPQLTQWTPDFSHQRVALVMMGQKPSLGYAIELQPPVTKTGDTVSLPVKQTEPPAGSLVAAALSSPCAYTVVNSSEFSTLQVTDSSDGSVLFEWTR